MERDYHRNAINFASSLADHERGGWGVFAGWGFVDGRLVPDYGNCRGIYRTRNLAEREALRCRRLFFACHCIEQV